MYVYNYRLFDRYNRTVVSLAILGDDRPSWRPDNFGYQLWGCRLAFQYPVVKLLDYAADQAALAANPNPFAAVVAAHLKTQETQHDPEARRLWKVQLIKGLYERGLAKDEVREFFRVIDWMMDLPRPLEDDFWQEIRRFEEEKKMPYVTSVERHALERGRLEGREEGRLEGRQEGRLEGRQEGQADGLRRAIEVTLTRRFGAEAEVLVREIKALDDVIALEAALAVFATANTIEDARRAWSAQA